MSATLLNKIRNKGLWVSLQIFCEHYLYHHWELLTLERQLALPTPSRALGAHRTLIEHIERTHVPMLACYFSRYRRAVESLLDQGLHGIGCCDDQGNIIAMMWISERDYYDDQLYHCWVRLPPHCIYQFAGEVALPHRGSEIALVVQHEAWDAYRQRGFTHTRALVNTRNQPALKMHVHLDFDEIGEAIHVYCLFGCLYYNHSAPYHEPRLLHLRKKKPAVGPPTQKDAL